MTKRITAEQADTVAQIAALCRAIWRLTADKPDNIIMAALTTVAGAKLARYADSEDARDLFVKQIDGALEDGIAEPECYSWLDRPGPAA